MVFLNDDTVDNIYTKTPSICWVFACWLMESVLAAYVTELIHANSQTPEERHQVFLLKKRIVDTILEEARIDENREIHIKFRTDFLTHVG